MTTPTFPAKGRTYALLAAAVSTLLTLSVVLPLALGDRPDDGDQALQTSPQLTTGDLPPLVDPVVPTAPGTPTATATTALPNVPVVRPTRTPAALDPFAPIAPSADRPREPRRASDQGITSGAAKIGVFLVDLARASQLGARVPGYDVESQKRYVESLVTRLNARGGVDGRRLSVVYRTVDITDAQSMDDACTSFGETDRVFAVAQLLGVYGPALLKCAVDEKLPFLSNDGAISSYYPQAKGYLITTQPSTRRTLLNMEDVLWRAGELTGRTVGVLYEDGYLLDDSRALVAQVRKRGLTVVEGVTSSSDVVTALRQIPVVAQDFCNKGVDYVLLAVNELYTQQFVGNAGRFPGCRPSYAVSDFDFAMNGDAFLDGQADAFFDHAVAVTAGRVGEGRVGLPEPAIDAACREDYEAATGTRLDRNASATSDYFTVQAACGLLRVLLQGMTAAGPNPTRASFVTAVGRIGEFANPGYGTSSFAPDRYDAPTVVRFAAASLDCKCWKPRSGFAPAAYR